MASTKKIIEEIGRLSVRDRRVVIKHLEQLKVKSSTGRRRPPATPHPAKVRPYAALLDLAGRAHSNEVDVSGDKYRHLGAAYADTHDSK
jgi:hypothetical protein